MADLQAQEEGMQQAVSGSGRQVQEGSLGEWEWEANARREAAKRMADLQAQEEGMQQAVSGSGEASAGRELG